MALYVGNTRYTPMLGNSRASFMVEDALPYDAEIEYLESTGTQYINLPYNMYQKSNFKIFIDYVPTRFFNYNMFLSFNNNTTYETYFGSSGNCVWKYMGSNVNSGTHVVNTRYSETFTVTTDDSNTHMEVTNVSGGTNTKDLSVTSVSTNGNVILYRRNTNYAEIKLYGFKLTVDSVLIFDLIPVRKGQVGYLYDRVSKQLFGNAGTGSFILGNDKN